MNRIIHTALACLVLCFAVLPAHADTSTAQLFAKYNRLFWPMVMHAINQGYTVDGATAALWIGRTRECIPVLLPSHGNTVEASFNCSDSQGDLISINRVQVTFESPTPKFFTLMDVNPAGMEEACDVQDAAPTAANGMQVIIACWNAYRQQLMTVRIGRSMLVNTGR